MSKRDYYEILGVPKNAARSADQERVSQAGAATPSRSQPGQQGRRGEIQGGRRGLRDSLRWRQAGALRPVRPCGCVVAGRSGLRSVDVRRLRRHVRRHLRRLLRRRPARRPRARKRPALRPRDHVRRIRQRRRDDDRYPAARDVRHMSRLRRRARQHARRRVRSARAADSSDSSRDFSPSRGRAPAARARAASSRSRAPRAKARDARRRSGSSPSRFRRVSPTASGSASAAKVRADAQSGPPAISTCSSKSRHIAFFRREGNNLACEIPLNFTTLALGGSIDVPTLDGTESFKVPEGTQSGSVFRLRGKGMPDVSGTRPRRSLLHRAGGDAEEAQQGTARRARTARQDASEGKVRAAWRANAEEDEKNLFEKVKDIFG